MRILRHELDITDYQTLPLPVGEVLSVAASRTQPELKIDLWALDRETDRRVRTSAFYIVGTGHPMPERLETELERFERDASHDPDRYWRRFIGTIVTPGWMVWHVFQGPVL